MRRTLAHARRKCQRSAVRRWVQGCAKGPLSPQRIRKEAGILLLGLRAGLHFRHQVVARRFPICQYLPESSQVARIFWRARSADFQSAVSQGFQPAGRGAVERFGPFVALADWKSAIQQVGNLRYSGNPRYEEVSSVPRLLSKGQRSLPDGFRRHVFSDGF